MNNRVVSAPISYKDEFMRWKKEREAEGMVFFSRLSDVIDTDRELAVRDMVMFTNEYGITFGPYEVLAFGAPHYGRCVYLAKSSYWFPVAPWQLTILSKAN